MDPFDEFDCEGGDLNAPHGSNTDDEMDVDGDDDTAP